MNNFVSFRDFYSRRDKAIFQAGTLYLDQRSCELSMTVEDPGRHALMAGLAGAYLAYCDVVRKATGEKLQIVAAFTGGDPITSWSAETVFFTIGKAAIGMPRSPNHR